MATSLGELATRFGCDLDGDPETRVDCVAPLDSAGPGALSFLSNSRLKDQLLATKAAAVVLRESDADDCPVAALIADDPYATYARIAALLYPLPPLQPGVHATAVVDASTQVGRGTEIAAHAFVGPDCSIGDDVYVGPGCFIGPGCSIGSGSRLVARVSLARNVRLGVRAVIHPGAVIGSDGFGNAMTPEGWLKVPQVGGVTIGNDVEIGANTTIDCGAITDTVIEDGVRIDNLCMIAHNVHIGAHTALAAQTGIAGSAVIGKRCLFAGHSGTVGHIRVCDDVIVNGKTMITKDVTEPGAYAGAFPGEDAKTWNRRVARFRRIDGLLERIASLEKKS